MLSRAFRNRFIELHFDVIPSGELETILHERCSIPLSYSKKLVTIMLELQVNITLKSWIFLNQNLSKKKNFKARKPLQNQVKIHSSPFSVGGHPPTGPPTCALPWTHWETWAAPDHWPNFLSVYNTKISPIKICNENTWVERWKCYFCGQDKLKIDKSFPDKAVYTFMK
jgi:hypothetical protein